MNERQYFDLKTLEQRYASAYAALPERYRKESLLLFFLDVNGNVWAEPGIGQIPTLGDSTWVFVDVPNIIKGWIRMDVVKRYQP